MANADARFPTLTTGVTVETATAGALSGDGSSGNKLAVGVDGVTITVNGSNELEAAGSITGADTQVLFFDGTDHPAGDAGLTFDKTTDALSAGVVKVNAPYTSSGDVRIGLGTIVGRVNGVSGENVPLIAVAESGVNPNYPVVTFGEGGLNCLQFDRYHASTILGNGNDADGQDNILIFGESITATAANQLWVGSGSSAIDDVFIRAEGAKRLTVGLGSIETSSGAFLKFNAGEITLFSDGGDINFETDGYAIAFAQSIGVTGTLTATTLIPTANYKSVDGTNGATAGPFTVVSSIQVKNGLVTTLTGT